MKKNLLLLTAMSIFAVSAMGSTDPVEKKSTEKINKASNVSLTYETPQKIKLTVLDNEKGAIDLAVINKQTGKKIADHVLTYDKSFALPIDMSSEKDGQYMFSIKGEDFELNQEVFLSSLHKDDIYASISEIDKGIYTVKVLHDDIPVTVKIVDCNGKVYHRYLHTSNSNFQQTYDLKQITDQKELYISISGLKTQIFKAL